MINSRTSHQTFQQHSRDLFAFPLLRDLWIELFMNTTVVYLGYMQLDFVFFTVHFIKHLIFSKNIITFNKDLCLFWCIGFFILYNFLYTATLI